MLYIVILDSTASPDWQLMRLNFWFLQMVQSSWLVIICVLRLESKYLNFSYYTRSCERWICVYTNYKLPIKICSVPDVFEWTEFPARFLSEFTEDLRQTKVKTQSDLVGTEETWFGPVKKEVQMWKVYRHRVIRQGVHFMS